MKPKVNPRKKFGRPVCIEFEQLVLEKCINELKENSNSNYVEDNGTYSYSLIKKCAMEVMNTQYPDEQGNMIYKWQMNELTKSLKFSNKWMYGFSKRISARQNLSSSYAPLYDTQFSQIPNNLPYQHINGINNDILGQLTNANIYEGNESDDDDDDDDDDSDE
jgi:hypothetical protein